ncbi:hypothetical protein TERMP_01251 [Thermococcus barophilus MP]|uniref:Nucleoside phosphorylase domain-containing protein n=2 Tax=Thermococcus barophilus TaxID=55802 RepID=F0LH19_THEBM|nr:hypothetical protein TERMP_01251 [Thermococcus barophilus MP]
MLVEETGAIREEVQLVMLYCPLIIQGDGNKVRDYSSRGILGVEMEASALMSVASFRGVDLAVALAVSDELYKGKWNPGFGSKKLKRTERLLVKAALETLISL